MSYATAAEWALGFIAAWVVAYALLRNRWRSLTVYPFFLIYRLGYSRTPFGLSDMKARFSRIYGAIGVAIATFMMAYFYYVSLQLFIEKYVARVPGAAAEGFVPIIPGVTVGLSEFIFILVAIGVAVLVHELSHALIARSVGVPVKDAGLLLFAFIPAAFVEPDEEQVSRASLRSKAMIYAAGIASNAIIGLLFAYVLTSLTPLLASGITIVSVNANSPAQLAGLKAGMRILAIDGKPVKTVSQGLQILAKLGAESSLSSVNVSLTVAYRDTISTIVVYKPVNESGLGIYVTQSFRLPWLVNIVLSMYIVNLGLALVNAAPFAIPFPGLGVETDGAQLLRDALAKVGGSAGKSISMAIELLTLLIIISLITLTPIRLP